MPLSQERVVAALAMVTHSQGKSLTALKKVQDVHLHGDVVELAIEADVPMRENIERDVRAALKQIGASDVKLRWAQAATGNPLPQVKNVVAVGAGKGGVGKSTMACNLAVGLQRAGYRVGVMDGDIYGPSLPTILGIKGIKPFQDEGKLIPIEAHGLHIMTIGSLVEQDKPLIWRGPMAHGAFKNLLIDYPRWPELDYLIVDLPPGTGDVPLSLCQMLPVTGAVVVATPQQVALDDCVRAVKMFEQLGAPVLGIIENMSYLPTPDGGVIDLFGRGGAKKAADALGLAFLGEIPIYPELRINSDEGTPIKNYEGTAGLREALEFTAKRLDEVVRDRNLRAAPVGLEIG